MHLALQKEQYLMALRLKPNIKMSCQCAAQRGYFATQIEINHNDISRFSHSLSVSTRDTLDTDTPSIQIHRKWWQ